MNKINVLEIKRNETIMPEIMLKVTALHYFTEALYKEKYEECNELAKTAKEYGVAKKEIKAIIADYVKWARGLRKLETVLMPKKGYRF